MPIYEYFCDRCGNKIEHISKCKERPETVKCECTNDAKLIISKSSFIINGYNYKNGYSK